jgi:serine/threonine-protein phosphatase 6 regulatory subunit 3
MASQSLVPSLVNLMSHRNSERVQLVSCEILKGVISMSSPSQGQTGLSEGLHNHAPASNVLARGIASQLCIFQLGSYVFRTASVSETVPRECTSDDNLSSLSSTTRIESDPLTSSVVQAASVIVDLIRKNSSDYLEPYLFHTLRNRLIQVQQHLSIGTDSSREVLEGAMWEMTRKIGVVHFEFLLLTMSQNIQTLKASLERPRVSIAPPISILWLIQ